MIQTQRRIDNARDIWWVVPDPKQVNRSPAMIYKFMDDITRLLGQCLALLRERMPSKLMDKRLVAKAAGQSAAGGIKPAYPQLFAISSKALLPYRQRTSTCS